MITKKFYFLICSSLCALLFTNCRSGLVTMTNACYNAIKEGNAYNASGNYSAAADKFNIVLQKCDAYDAKEKGYAGLATAYNGMQQYSEALNTANAGLKISNTSVDNLFQKAAAELGLNMQAEAKADFAKIIDMTTKNRNVKDRATIYAKIAELDLKQNMYSDAANNVEAAIRTDNTNPDFYILKGDVYAAQSMYTDAISAYNQAITYSGNSARVWQAKVEAETKMMQKKYGTGSNTSDLAAKISAADRQTLCSDIAQAKNYGVNMQSIDLLQLAICK
ncbi:tetratricopeptide repeat protein [Parafilimonas sp.]|uniref:tetratricopeptide repeat protein n=1 Tax=Parafilimonas sp. TaxID=1969739 RepID=UPI0039E3D596